MTTHAKQFESAANPVALVTGAGRRVGNQLVRALAAAGYRVVLHADRSMAEAQATVAELAAAGQEAFAVAADLRDERANRAMVRQSHDRWGRIDALVNCAAIWIPKPLEEVTAADVQAHFEVNALASFVCAQEAGLLMARQSTGGAIVNVGDWAVARPYLNYAAYFISKGSIGAMTRMLAVELAARNPRVRVNAVLPGPVLFPADMTDAERQAVVEATLVKQPGTPADVAGAVLYLLTAGFVTGVCLPIDGGRSVFAPGPHD